MAIRVPASAIFHALEDNYANGVLATGHEILHINIFELNFAFTSERNAFTRKGLTAPPRIKSLEATSSVLSASHR